MERAKISDYIGSVFRDANGDDHRRPGNKRPRCRKVFIQVVVIPGQAGILQGVGVSKIWIRRGRPPDNVGQDRPHSRRRAGGFRRGNRLPPDPATVAAAAPGAPVEWHNAQFCWKTARP